MGEKSSTNPEQVESPSAESAGGDLAARLEQLLGDIESAQEAIAEVAKDAGLDEGPAITPSPAGGAPVDADGIVDLDAAVEGLLAETRDLSQQIEAAEGAGTPGVVGASAGVDAAQDEPEQGGGVVGGSPAGEGGSASVAGQPEATPVEDGAIPAVEADTIEDLDAQLAELTEGLLEQDGAGEDAGEALPGERGEAEVEAPAPPPAPMPEVESAAPAEAEAPSAPVPEPEPEREGVGVALGVGEPKPSALAVMVARALAPLSAPLRGKSEMAMQTIGWVAATTLFMGGVLWAIVMTRSEAASPVGSAGAFDFSASSVPHVPEVDHGKGGQKDAGEAGHGKAEGGHGKPEEPKGHGKADAKKDDGHGKKGSEKKAPEKKSGAKKDSAKKDAGHGEKKSGGH